MGDLLLMWMYRIATSLAILFGGFAAIKITNLMMMRTASKLHWDEIIVGYFRTFKNVVIGVLTISYALGALGIELGPIMATIGIGGFMIGFGARQSIGNYFAGLTLLVSRSFQRGDLVDVSNQLGRVDEIKLSYTSLTTLDNVKVVIPNLVAWRGKILNYSAHDRRAIRFQILIPDGTDADFVKDVCLDVLSRHEAVLNEPAASMSISDVTPTGVIATLTAWSTPDSMNVFGDVIKEMRKDLEEAGLVATVPNKDIDLRKEE